MSSFIVNKVYNQDGSPMKISDLLHFQTYIICSRGKVVIVHTKDGFEVGATSYFDDSSVFWAGPPHKFAFGQEEEAHAFFSELSEEPFWKRKDVQETTYRSVRPVSDQIPSGEWYSRARRHYLFACEIDDEKERQDALEVVHLEQLQAFEIAREEREERGVRDEDAPTPRDVPTALSNEPLGAEELGADFFTTVR